MPKPSQVESSVRDWLATERGDSLTAFVRVITRAYVNPTTPGGSSVAVADLTVPLEMLGRDLGDMWGGLPGDTRALTASPGMVRVLRLSGWKERVKAAVVEAPLPEVVVHHLDQTTRAGLGIRYFVLDLPDGRWLADSHVIVKKNGDRAPYADHSDAFVAALGPRARPLG